MMWMPQVVVFAGTGQGLQAGRRQGLQGRGQGLQRRNQSLQHHQCLQLMQQMLRRRQLSSSDCFKCTCDTDVNELTNRIVSLVDNNLVGAVLDV